ncbi:unnamed protein product [Pleuronectes platessa]|uniref:Uncharacterized protein n=1 Tax=Pleuronectes platessa TaxID=8262 RepID=A0A9N7VEK3_PLEPL|nr:unnamed protein product [Pleuronectes platessa]
MLLSTLSPIQPVSSIILSPSHPVHLRGLTMLTIIHDPLHTSRLGVKHCVLPSPVAPAYQTQNTVSLLNTVSLSPLSSPISPFILFLPRYKTGRLHNRRLTSPIAILYTAKHVLPNIPTSFVISHSPRTLQHNLTAYSASISTCDLRYVGLTCVNPTSHCLHRASGAKYRYLTCFEACVYSSHLSSLHLSLLTCLPSPCLPSPVSLDCRTSPVVSSPVSPHLSPFNLLSSPVSPHRSSPSSVSLPPVLSSPVSFNLSLLTCLPSPVSLHLSPFTCLPSPGLSSALSHCHLSLSSPVSTSPVSPHLSPFTCPLLTCLSSPVSPHLSPLICLPCSPVSPSPDLFLILCPHRSIPLPFHLSSHLQP